MRLLNTTTLQVEDATVDSVSYYAILSHMWGAQEVTFQDMQVLHTSPDSASVIRGKLGFGKLQGAASLAARNGFKYVWIDTCCIDKSSSAELSEAINSMYQWYRDSTICYAYISDIRAHPHDPGNDALRQLSKSRWFSRGWTLQELIAPAEVLFFDSEWSLLGRLKTDAAMRRVVSEASGIDTRVLDGTRQLTDMSVAHRMKWASNRQTTRPEDEAYCLMGIFDVNMPLLYGEGRKAFIRLQEEILKNSDDQSIFSWSGSSATPQLCGLLAESPRLFQHAGAFKPLPPNTDATSEIWSMTNKGLRVSLFLSEDGTTHKAILDCVVRNAHGDHLSPVIALRRLHEDQFARIRPGFVGLVPTPSWPALNHGGTYTTVFVKQKPQYVVPQILVPLQTLKRVPPDAVSSLEVPAHVEDVWPQDAWDPDSGTLSSRDPDLLEKSKVVSMFRYSFIFGDSESHVDFAVVLGQGHDGIWGCRAFQRPSSGTIEVAVQSAESGTLGYEPSEGPGDGWSIDVSSGPITVLIHETRIHGRLYFNIRPLRMVPQSWKTLEGAHQNLAALSATMPKGLRPGENLPSDLGSWLKYGSTDVKSETIQDRFQSLVSSSQGVSLPVDHEQSTESWLAQVTKRPFRKQGLDGPDLDLIHKVCLAGKLKQAQKSFKAGPNPTIRTREGWTVLHIVAAMGHFHLMSHLLGCCSADCSVDISPVGVDCCDQDNQWGESPLHLSLLHYLGDLDENERRSFFRVMDFYKKDISTWTRGNHSGETPLHRAIQHKTSSFMYHLDYERHYASPGQIQDGLGRTLLWYVVRLAVPRRTDGTPNFHSLRTVQALLQPLLSSQAKVLSNKADCYGVAPLHLACQNGNADLVSKLLEYGADPNARTIDPGLTPMHYAALHDHENCVFKLLDRGADAHLPLTLDWLAYTPLELGRKMMAFGTAREILRLQYGVEPPPPSRRAKLRYWIEKGSMTPCGTMPPCIRHAYLLAGKGDAARHLEAQRRKERETLGHLQADSLRANY